MINSLWKTLKIKARGNVRFLNISIIISIGLFLIPITVNHGIDIKNAEASNWVESALTYILDNTLGFFLKLISRFLFNICSYILTISASIFKTSVEFSLSGNLFSSFDFINSGWVFIRDLINSLFIFAVLFTAMKQLLSLGGAKEIQKTLVNLVIAALLINFSLFFTKAAIDVSNFTTRAIYYTMEVKGEGNDAEVEYGPAEFLVKGLNIHEVLKKDQQSSNNDGEESNFVQSIVYLGGTAVSIAATILFFAMAFFFVARIIILLLLMMTSPVFFITYVINIKQLSEYRTKWIQTLKGQLIFPVVFMLIIYIAVLYIDAGNITGNNVTSSGIANGSPSALMLIINYAIILYLMYFSLKLSKDFAGEAGKFGTKWAGASAAKAFSVGAFAGRQTLGRAGGAMANSKWANNMAKSNNKFTRLIGDKIAVGGGKAMHEGSWDVRNSGQMGKMYGYANKSFGQLNVGKATTKNAKNDNRDLAGIKADVKSRITFNDKHNIEAFSKLSSEGKKKEVAIQTKRINSFNTIDAKVNETKSRIGKNINESEYKEYKNKLITEIRTEYKDDYVKQKELIVALSGEDAYKKEQKEFKKEAILKIREKNKNDIDAQETKLREFLGDEYNSQDHKDLRDSIEKGKKGKKVKGAASGYDELQSQNTQRINERQTLINQGHTPNSNQRLRQLEEELRPLIEKENEFKNNISQADTKSITEIAAKDIQHFSQQLNKAHLMAIHEKMSAGGYQQEDMVILENMIKELRKSRQTDEIIKNWINDEITRGTAAFNVDLTSDIESKLATIGNNTPQASDAREIDNIMRAISGPELQKLSLDQVLHKEIISRIKPQQLKKYIDRIIEAGDQATIQRLTDLATEIKMRNPNVINENTLSIQGGKQIASVLLGENITQSRGGTQYRGRQNRNRPRNP